jgi:hypothetical protein
MRDHFKHAGAVDYALLRSSDEMSRAEDGAAIPAQRKRAPPPPGDQTWSHKRGSPWANLVSIARTLAA